MFDVINGVPVHPLVVHAVVVLMPLAILGTIALVVRPAWRRTFGPLLVGISVIATVLIPVATSSGESLEKHVGDPGQHAHLGDQLIWFMIPLLLLDVVLVVLDRRTTLGRNPMRVVGVLAIVAAVAAGVQVYRVGDSGAKAVWHDQVTSSATVGK
ncbi:DUF2231 domain-containing protein [Nocardioides montaniterrae]